MTVDVRAALSGSKLTITYRTAETKYNKTFDIEPKIPKYYNFLIRFHET